MQTFSVLMNKKDDAMARLYGFLCGRALHVHHSTVGASEDGRHWRVTLMIDPERTCPDKLVRELHRLMDVVSVTRLKTGDCVSRQYALLGVRVDTANRPFVRRLADLAGARMVRDTPEEMVLEVTGCQDSIDAFVDNVRTVGRVRMTCTGPIAL